jgi:2-deoxy-D-gluconate 3-dehydrogenase
MAKALHEAGAKVVLCDISEDVYSLRDFMGGPEAGVFAVRADLCDEKDLERAFREAVELAGGRIHILLNGAGIQHRCEAMDFPGPSGIRYCP